MCFRLPFETKGTRCQQDILRSKRRTCCACPRPVIADNKDLQCLLCVAFSARQQRARMVVLPPCLLFRHTTHTTQVYKRNEAKECVFRLWIVVHHLYSARRRPEQSSLPVARMRAWVILGQLCGGGCCCGIREHVRARQKMDSTITPAQNYCSCSAPLRSKDNTHPNPFGRIYYQSFVIHIVYCEAHVWSTALDVGRPSHGGQKSQVDVATQYATTTMAAWSFCTNFSCC
jgi:hypothetical protein